MDGRALSVKSTSNKEVLAMSDTPTYADQLRELSRLWWLPVCLGLLSIVAGVIVLIKPEDSLVTITVVVGIFVVIDGIAALVASLGRSTENRGLAALIGVLGLVVGVMLIRHPIHGIVAVALLVGIWLIAMGAMRFVLAFDADGHRAWRLLIAAVETIAGIVIVSSPGIGLTTLALLIGISLIANGASLTALGFALHGAGDDAPVSHKPAAAV
jgi:uncharacterized membrane protein HdeD (DUF308 family)